MIIPYTKSTLKNRGMMLVTQHVGLYTESTLKLEVHSL